MPELPELEAISKYLTKKLSGEIIARVETFFHTVIRFPDSNTIQTLLVGARLEKVSRKGKLIVFQFRSIDTYLRLCIDHGLTGRFAWEKVKAPAKTVLRLKFQSGSSLIYHDRRLHGAIWLFHGTNKENTLFPSKVRNYGPDILTISLDEFKARISRYRGEIKGVLTKQEFVTGIGNAYADEVLFNAQIHPFTKRTNLSSSEIERLYKSCTSILGHGVSEITNWLFTSDKIDNQRFWRKELFKIHLRGEQPCYNCGKSVSTIKANRRITNFCRTCQTSRNKNFI